MDRLFEEFESVLEGRSRRAEELQAIASNMMHHLNHLRVLKARQDAHDILKF